MFSFTQKLNLHSLKRPSIVTDQTAPLPILILATIFIVVWNMDPFVVEESSGKPIPRKEKILQSSQFDDANKTNPTDHKPPLVTDSVVFQNPNTNQVQRLD